MNPSPPIMALSPLLQTLVSAPHRLVDQEFESARYLLGDHLYTCGPDYRLTAEKFALLQSPVQIGIGLQELRFYLERKDPHLHALLPNPTEARPPIDDLAKRWEELAVDVDHLQFQWGLMSLRPDAFIARIEVLRRAILRAGEESVGHAELRGIQEKVEARHSHLMTLGEGIAQMYRRLPDVMTMEDVANIVHLELNTLPASHQEQPEESLDTVDNLQIYLESYRLMALFLTTEEVSDEDRTTWLAGLHELRLALMTTWAALSAGA